MELIATYDDGIEFQNNQGTDNYEWKLLLGKDLPDGDYQIVPVSRLHQSVDYYPNVNGMERSIKVNITGNELVVLNGYELSCDARIEGEMMTERPVKVVANITNHRGLYSSDIYLIGGIDGNAYLCGKLLTLGAGESEEVILDFTPKKAGTYRLYVCNRDFIPLCDEITVTVRTNTVTKGNLAFSKIELYSPQAQYGVYGNSIKGAITLTNMSDTEMANSGIVIKLAKWLHDGSGLGNFVASQSVETNVAKRSEATYEFEFSGLSIATQHESYDYSIYLYYTDDTFIGDGSIYSFLCYPGITFYKADGSVTTMAPGKTVKVGDDVAAIDVSSLSTVSLVTPNTNPNTLYYVNPGKVPSGLAGKNVVKGNVAETIHLVEGKDFYLPASFTARKATFTRQFAKGIDNANGWSTIMLPFEVQTIACGSKELQPEADYWILEETAEEQHGVMALPLKWLRR